MKPDQENGVMKKAAVTKFLSRTALGRKPSPIRVISDYLFSLPPGKEVLTLAAGMPASSTFPIKSMDVTLQDGSRIKVNPGMVGPFKFQNPHSPSFPC